jgi:hypothetical protein
MRDELQAQVDALEAADTFPSRQALWCALARTPWAQGRGLTARALETHARRLGVAARTPKGVGNRFGRQDAEPVRSRGQPSGAGCGPLSASPACGAEAKPAPQRLPLPLLRSTTPRRYYPLVERIEAGSLRAAIKLKCLECSNYQVQEVRLCTVTDCPLHSVRPYQP